MTASGITEPWLRPVSEQLAKQKFSA